MDFTSLASTINDMANKKDALEKQLNLAKKQLQLMIEEYDEIRTNYFIDEMLNMKKTWCTACKSIVSMESASIILTEGKELCKKINEIFGGPSRRTTYRLYVLPFSRLQQVCPKCKANLVKKHGVATLVSTFEGKKEIYTKTYDVIFQNDHYTTALDGNEWKPIRNETELLPKLPQRFVSIFSEQLNIQMPPDLKSEYHYLFPATSKIELITRL